MGTTSLGFKTPKHDTIELRGFDVFFDDQPLNTGSETSTLPWSDRASVTVTAEIWTDLQKLCSETGYDAVLDSAPPSFGCVISWKATGTGIHGSSKMFLVKDGSTEITLEIDGSLLGAELILTPSVVLADAPRHASAPLAPSRAGSRLWECSFRVRLEGQGSQFPTSTLDFAKSGFTPEEALWIVKIPGDLESHFSSAVRLYLNTGVKRTAEYVNSPNDASQVEFAAFLEADVVTQLLTYAFNCDADDLRGVAEEPGTFAETLLDIYGTYFPNLEFEDAVDRFRQDPGFLHGMILGKTFRGTERKTTVK